ncbi:MAG TPA: CBS domain-containing protein [Ramlibacter sp.]|uniref:CBS domain-containing protein n=1 Tax=Ramlibacter sp. TaxID=1917967 RepID=UPI002ED4CB6F
MTIGEVCNRNVVHAAAGVSVREAARLMREQHVGTVVIVDERNGARFPVGIVTDRDIAIAVVALGLDPAVIEAGDLMAPRFAAVDESWGIAEVVQLMQVKGVHRMVVTAGDGALLGIVAKDDLLSLLAEELSALANISSSGREREARLRRAVA